MATSDNERRRYHRVACEAPARLFSDVEYHPCRLINISIKGALVRRPPNWHGGAGDRCLLEISLEDESPVEMEVNIVRVEDDYVACDWDMFDVRGFVALRRMLEKEIDDPEQIAQDLEALHAEQDEAAARE